MQSEMAVSAAWQRSRGVRSTGLSIVVLSPLFAVVEDLRPWWQNPVGLHGLLDAFLCWL